MTAAVLVTGCAQQPYFDAPADVDVAAPMGTDDSIYVGIWPLVAQFGDVVELDELEFVDAELDNVDVTPLAVDMSDVKGDSIGVIPVAATSTANEAVSRLEPLAGFRFRSDEAIGSGHVVVRVDGLGPGVASFRAVRLSFSVNGGPSQVQEITSGIRLCIDDPKPARCDP